LIHTHNYSRYAAKIAKTRRLLEAGLFETTKFLGVVSKGRFQRILSAGLGIKLLLPEVSFDLFSAV